MSLPGVSVIIPLFNGASFVAAAIESVLSQDYPGVVEVLICDDGSTDGGADIASAYGPPVYVLQRPDGSNRGPSAARNRCASTASQSLLAFLDSDDAFLPGHLLRLGSALAQDPALDLVAESGEMTMTNGQPIGEKPHRHAGGVVHPAEILLDQWFPPCAVMIRRDAFESVGGFDESLRYAEDQDLWLRIVENRKGVFLKTIGYRYRLHPGQASGHAAMWDSARIVLDHAVARYRYPNLVIRKRLAVLAYRRAEVARIMGNRRAWAGGLIRAALCDPLRAATVLLRTWKTR